MPLLLDDRLAPITSEIGFLEAPCATAARSFVEWQAPIHEARGVTLRIRRVDGSLEAVLLALQPLTSVERRRHLFLPTRSAWTAYLDNGYQGTDAASTMSFLAERLHCRALRVVQVENTVTSQHRSACGQYGATILELYGPEQTDFLNYVRSVSVANDGGRWVFDQAGTVQPFEDTARYQARRIQDRFTPDMLADYLRALGVRAFEEDFYMPPGDPTALLVEKIGSTAPNMQEYSLKEAKASFDST
jgi:hypothetical protein